MLATHIYIYMCLYIYRCICPKHAFYDGYNTITINMRKNIFESESISLNRKAANDSHQIDASSERVCGYKAVKTCTRTCQRARKKTTTNKQTHLSLYSFDGIFVFLLFFLAFLNSHGKHIISIYSYIYI